MTAFLSAERVHSDVHILDDDDNDLTAHEQQCTKYIAYNALINEMIAKGTWNTLSRCMDDNNRQITLSNPKLNSMAEVSLKAIDVLNCHFVILRHLDMVASTSHKTYDEAVRRSSMTMNQILLSTITGSSDGLDPFEEAVQIITMLKQTKDTFTESIEKRVCEHIDLTDATIQSVLETHQHYKEQIRNHRS